MQFSLFKEYGALNSKPVFEAFEHSLLAAGHEVVYNTMYSDVAVIWSVLFNGRMAENKAVWEHYRNNNRNVIVLEVGGIHRGTTWKVGVNGINRSAYFGSNNNDQQRATELGLNLTPWQDQGEHILICGQHNKSLQWQNQPSMGNWFLQTYKSIRKHTKRPIIFRPHPRCRLPEIEKGLKHVYREIPQPVSNTYDDFDMKFKNTWATINWSSNPGIHSVIQGVPAFTSNHSLAYDVANDIDFLHDIENPYKPDRRQWLNDYAWTEFTVEEIAKGIPLERLTKYL